MSAAAQPGLRRRRERRAQCRRGAGRMALDSLGDCWPQRGDRCRDSPVPPFIRIFSPVNAFRDGWVARAVRETFHLAYAQAQTGFRNTGSPEYLSTFSLRAIFTLVGAAGLRSGLQSWAIAEALGSAAATRAAASTTAMS